MTRPAPAAADPVVFLPGAFLTGAMFAPQIAALDGARASIVLDPAPEPAFEPSVSALLQTAPARFHLVAFCIGGFPALEMLRRAPERILSAMLIGANGAPDTPQEQRARRLAIRLAEGPDAARQLWRFRREALVGSLARASWALHDVFRAIADATPPEMVARQMRMAADRPDQRTSLNAIAAPVLCVSGAESHPNQRFKACALAKAIPNARFAEIEQAGHVVTLERPGPTTDLLRGWLSDSAVRRGSPRA